MALKDDMKSRQSKETGVFQVTRGGQFISRGVDKANYATMVLVRVKITRWAFEALSDGVTTAVRYSAVRRQTSLKPGSVLGSVYGGGMGSMSLFVLLVVAYMCVRECAGVCSCVCVWGGGASVYINVCVCVCVCVSARICACVVYGMQECSCVC